jgi:hypothetical protein
LVEDFGPGGLGALFVGGDVVDAASCEREREEKEREDGE